MKQSKLITVPIKARSSKTHPEVHLAYITDKEQDLLIKKDLYGSLKGKPNRGPGGLPSLEGDFGSSTGRTYSPAPERDVSARQATGEGGQKYTKNKGTVSTGTGVKKAATVAGFIKNPVVAGLTWTAKKIFSRKPKGPTRTEETAAMEDAYVKRKPVPVGGGPGDRDGTPQITLNTQALASTAIPETKKSGWGFKPYPTSSTFKSTLY